MIGRLAAGLLGLVLVCGCAPPGPPAPGGPDPDRFLGERAFAEVEDFIALGPRDSGTPGAERAASYLHDRLTALGVDAEIQAFKDESPIGVITFRNVLGRIPGSSERTVVLLSHYDTKSGISTNFVGANDSGSSTGALLELARVLKDGPQLVDSLLLAFVDGEEAMRDYGPTDGLHGSRHLAKTLRDANAPVEAVIVLDMIGDRDLEVMIPANSTRALASDVLGAATRRGVRDQFRLSGMAILDDHVPFLREGYSAIDLIDFAFGDHRGENRFWHSDEDTIDKLSPESLEIVGRVVLEYLRERSTPQG